MNRSQAPSEEQGSVANEISNNGEAVTEASSRSEQAISEISNPVKRWQNCRRNLEKIISRFRLRDQ